MNNYQPIFVNGKQMGSSFTLDPSNMRKGSVTIVPNGGPPRVMEQEDFFFHIPEKGSLVRSMEVVAL